MDGLAKASIPAGQNTIKTNKPHGLSAISHNKRYLPSSLRSEGNYLLLRTAARLSSFHRKAKRLAFKAVLRCMGGDLSAVIASASRRPRTSMCLVMAGSRPVQIATPAFQPTPGLPRFHPRSSGILSTILGKSLDT